MKLQVVVLSDVLDTSSNWIHPMVFHHEKCIDFEWHWPVKWH